MSFGKRKSAPKSNSDRVPARPVEPTPRHPMLVIVRESSFKSGEEESWHLVSAVIDYVNSMLSQGLYRREELPPCAIQAYHADYYLAQVNNGGHSQFIHNAGENQQNVFQDATNGLTAMSADKHGDVLAEMISWVEKNPKTSEQQTGFEGGRDPLLDKLDDRFYAVENNKSMADLSAKWIRSWPELSIVADDEYGSAIKQLCTLNPKRENRLISQRVMKLHHWMTDPLHVALGVAATALDPVECLVTIRNAWGGNNIEIDGVKHMLWTLVTTRGFKFGVVTDTWSGLYEYLEHQNSEMPDPGDSDGMTEAIKDGRLSNFQPPTPGNKLSHVATEVSQNIIQLAQRTNAAAAVDMLLRQANIYAEEWVLSGVPVPEKDSSKLLLNWLFLTENKNYQIVITPELAGIREVGGDFIARVSLDEAEALWSLVKN